jgi:hypothetical protein
MSFDQRINDETSLFTFPWDLKDQALYVSSPIALSGPPHVTSSDPKL